MYMSLFRHLNYTHSPLFGAIGFVLGGMDYVAYHAMKNPDVQLKSEYLKSEFQDETPKKLYNHKSKEIWKLLSN